MPIDANIALGVKTPQIENPLNMFAKYQELATNKMKMDEYTAGVNERNSLAKMFADPNFDITKPETQNAVMQVAPRTGPALLKSFLDTKTANVDLKGKQFELGKKRHDDAILEIASFNTPEDALASLQRHAQDGSIPPEQAQAQAKAIASAPDFGAWKKQTLRSLLTSAQQLQQNVTSQDAGGTSRIVATPAYAGGGGATVVPGTEVTKTPTPDAILSASTARRGQDLANSPNLVATTQVSDDGTVRHYNKFGQEINAIAGAGKKSGTFAKTEAARKQMEQDLTTTISELESATKPGGLIETATGSGIGQAKNFVAGLVGHATDGAVALGALKPIYDKVLKMVPRFEGPQSDKDTATYNAAAGDLGNAATPVAIKMAAAKQILRLMKNRKAQFLTRDMAEGGTVVPDADHGVDTSNPLLK